MFSRSSIVLAFALAVTVSGHPFRKCGYKNVKAVHNVNYDEFIQQHWDIKFVPDHADFKNIKSAEISESKSINKGCSYKNTITYTNKDNSKTPTKVIEKYVADGTVFETVLDKNGKPNGETNIVTFYGYKKDAYAQYTICTWTFHGEDKPNEIDFRFVLVKKGYSLTPTDINDIEKNDKSHNFKGKIVELGSSGSTKA